MRSLLPSLSLISSLFPVLSRPYTPSRLLALSLSRPLIFSALSLPLSRSFESRCCGCRCESINRELSA